MRDTVKGLSSEDMEWTALRELELSGLLSNGTLDSVWQVFSIPARELHLETTPHTTTPVRRKLYQFLKSEKTK